MGRPVLALAVVAAASLSAAAALAWGATGHRLIGVAAVQSLPPELPAFLRTAKAAAEVGELAREPDRWKGSGKVHDSDRETSHFINLDDEGRTEGGMKLAELPATRAAYDVAVVKAGHGLERAGVLPYAIIDGYQQLVRDFAMWRADRAGAKLSKDRAHRSWLNNDAREREALLLRDLGVLGHYVGDGSQPLHVSVHYNGWGPGDNPNDYTRSRATHAMFEGAFVHDNLSVDQVRARMPAFHDCDCDIEQRVAGYLTVTLGQTEPFYRLQKDGSFRDGDKRGIDFTADRLAAGAAELRDLAVIAWRESATAKVGYPQVKVNEIEAGDVDPYDNLYGKD